MGSIKQRYDLLPSESLKSCSSSNDGQQLTVEFSDGKFTFHAQWLYDAKCEDGPSRTFHTAFCQTRPSAQIKAVKAEATVDIEWADGTQSSFPTAWLRVLAPLVARQHDAAEADGPVERHGGRGYSDGWTVDTLEIPQVSYSDLFQPASPEAFDRTLINVMDLLLNEASAGIIKVVDMPPANVESERDKTNTLVTAVLKRIFGAVFVHPRRGGEKTFNVASDHTADRMRGASLPNYDTNQVLLPHVDHAHYTHPIQIQGWYGLEGESENTFASSIAALRTLEAEAPELAPHLYTAPMAVGRLAKYYDPPLYQGTVDTAVTVWPGSGAAPRPFAPSVKRVRWHPHLTGSLLAPFSTFPDARAAHACFQEILRRDSHLLRTVLRPGDLYIWNNFRIVHGRERVLRVPRTGVGQTVPEQVVQEAWRSLLLKRLEGRMEDKWLVHLPLPQLRELVKLFEEGGKTCS